MTRTTTIAWTERTWNVSVGCSLASPGCSQCYAMRHAYRLSRNASTAEKYRGTVRMTKTGAVWTGKLNFWEPDLDKPLQWKKPSLIFVNSMSDIAHEDMPITWFARIVEVMRHAGRDRGHIFQVLTKRPENLARLLAAIGVTASLDGVWWGVSAEDERRWDERIPWLAVIPTKVRWVSVEPQLKQIDRDPTGLDWIVIGGESAKIHSAARPFELDWARVMIDRCRAQNVPVFMKQLGGNAWEGGKHFATRHSKGGDPTEWPTDLRIREYPMRCGRDRYA